MSQFVSAEKEIILALYESSGWLDLYSLHERFGLSPGQLANAMRKMTGLKIIEVDGLHARLNEIGRRWVVANRQSLFLDQRSRPWARPTQGGTPIPSLTPFTPYLPDLSGVQREFFLKR